MQDCGPNSPYIYQSQNSLDEILDLKKPELTCISEEGIADMDLPDNILEELEYLDNITSCNKVENCLMLSEYEQNLIKEKEGPVTLAYRKARKWSLVRQSSSIIQGIEILGYNHSSIYHLMSSEYSLRNESHHKVVNNLIFCRLFVGYHSRDNREEKIRRIVIVTLQIRNRYSHRS